MPFSLGEFELHVVSGGQLRLDGGTMFGVVPKVLWQQASAPDELNRIQMDTNCLLVRTPTHNVLIDTGYGTKASKRQREQQSLEPSDRLIENLSARGIEPGDVDMVILSHLHFDHAGGCTRYDASGKLRPTFAGAQHLIQRTEWEDATADRPELAGTYFTHDFLPLAEAGLLELIDGDVEVLPGISCRLDGGHTRGHQLIFLGPPNQRGLYIGDLCPTAAHLRPRWTMSYDQHPLELRRIKPAILAEAADNQWAVFFDHDPRIRGAYLGRDPKQEFIVSRTLM